MQFVSRRVEKRDKREREIERERRTDNREEKTRQVKMVTKVKKAVVGRVGMLERPPRAL